MVETHPLMLGLTHENNDPEPKSGGHKNGNGSSVEDIQIRWPEPLDEEAYYGLAGEIVKTIAPHTEADPAGLLLQLLTANSRTDCRTGGRAKVTKPILRFLRPE